MTEEQILECTIVVLDFLNDDTDKQLRSFNDDPIFIKMEKTLEKYDYSMINFCVFINKKYSFYPEPLWVKTGREFFSDDYSQPGPSKAKLMLNSIVRDSKLNDILC